MDSIEIKVPGLAGVVLKRRGPSSYKPPVVEEPKAAPKKRTSSVKPKPKPAAQEYSGQGEGHNRDQGQG